MGFISQWSPTSLSLFSIPHHPSPPDHENKMAPQQPPMSTSSTVALDGRIPTSEFVTLNIVEDEPLGGKEDETEVGPVIPTPDADDYPDGGLAAWSVVMGVSPLTDPQSFRVY